MSGRAFSTSRRYFLASLAATSLVPLRAARGQSAAPDGATASVQFSLDRPVDAIAAPFVLAAARGLYRAGSLNVITNVAAGSKDAIARVASGASDIALADLNALIRYRGDPDAAPVKAVFVLLNKAPYAIIARRSRGIVTPASLEGRTLGVADGDLAIRLWPALAHRIGVKLDTVKRENISAAVREPMLSAGQVDAVTGFSYLSAVNLRDRGVPADDLAVFRFADYGSAAYGLAVIVNPKFGAARPDAVKAFIRAVTAGTQMAISQPARAIDDVVAAMDNGSRDLELARLRIAIADNILTDDVRRDGLGGIDAARFDETLNEIAEDFTFKKRPMLADIFDDGFLPASVGRKIN